MNDTILEVQNVTKIYKLYDDPIDRLKESLDWRGKYYHRDFYALKNVSFRVKRGEIVGIIGKNGSGKSTLLKLITGVLVATSGNILVNAKISALLELGAGFNPEYTGIENIYFQGHLMGYTHKEIKDRLASIIEFADIGDFIYQQVKVYSSGMFARLAFAVAINVDPDILIIDEALSVGDANFQLKCHKKMDSLRANGVTILFVSHDTYSIKTLCSRVLYLKNGVQHMYGETIDVVNAYLFDLGHENYTDNNIALSDNNANMLPVEIKRVFVTGYDNQKDIPIKIFNTIELNVEYEVKTTDIEYLTLVFNIYRENDKAYICGSTTLMDNISPIKVVLGYNQFKLKLRNLPLLSGKYRVRIAINEKKGIGIITELNDALFLYCSDNHEAEGMINLTREWIV